MNHLLWHTDRRRGDRRRSIDRRHDSRGEDRRRADRRVLGVAAGIVLATSLAAPTRAQAQIYSWRDAKGTLVLSDRPLSADATKHAVPTYAVPQAPQVRTTKPAPPVLRTALYDHVINEHATSNGVRPDLVRAVIQVESNFDERARSPKGALGLMQLMPATAAELGVRNPFNPIENIRAGVAYLRRLLDRYSNNEELALAAYNAGPEAVARHGSKVPPYRETQRYVKTIMARTPTPTAPAPPTIYKTTEIIGGRSVPRFTETKPASGPYEIVSRR